MQKKGCLIFNAGHSGLQASVVILFLPTWAPHHAARTELIHFYIKDEEHSLVKYKICSSFEAVLSLLELSREL